MLGAEEMSDGTMRYQLLETLRQYAAIERLDAANETEMWRRAHARHYAEVAETAGRSVRRMITARWDRARISTTPAPR